MPGLSIAYQQEGFTVADEARIFRAMSVLLHDDRYQAKSLLDLPKLKVSFTGYIEYPFEQFEHGQYKCFVEGMIYNASERDVCRKLCDVLDSVRESHQDGKHEGFRRILLDCDGEFVILIFDAVNLHAHIFTDPLGQLPLFQMSSKSRAFVSREQKFITIAAGHHELDRIGIAQYLMYGFNFGDRTLSRDLLRCPPASHFEIDVVEDRFVKTSYFTWNLEVHTWRSASLDVHSREIVDLFGEAVRNRVKRFGSRRPVVSLSGGLDSRAILGQVAHCSGDTVAQTSFDEDRPNANDLRLAQQIAAVLGVPHISCRISRPTRDDLIRLLRTHDSCSAAFMASTIPFFDSVVKINGPNVALGTGLGGNTTMYPYLSPIKESNLEMLLERTLRFIYYVPPDLSATLVGLSEGEVWSSISDSVLDNPERDSRWKHAHYRMFGRAYRFVLEGEDRVRSFCWVLAPFESINLVRYMMTLPEEMKSHFRLYSKVLQLIDPRIVSIPYAATKIRVGISALPAYSRFVDFVHGHDKIYKPLRTLLVRYEQPNFHLDPADELLEEIFGNGIDTGGEFDGDTLWKLTRRGQPRFSYYLLLTVAVRAALINSDYAFPTVSTELTSLAG